MSDSPKRTPGSARSASAGAPLVVWAVLPLVILGGFVAMLLSLDLRSATGVEVPPIEEIVFERVVLAAGDGHDHSITIHVRNDGPDPVHIVQTLVDQAYWYHTMTPESGVLGRLQRGVIVIPYHWVEGEAHELRLLTESGVTFDHEIAVALPSPTVNGRYLGFFAMMGFYVGVVPILIGLLWFPALRRLSRRGWDFILFLTIGLLVFLGIDTVEEGLEMAEEVGHAFHPKVLFFVITVGMYLLLQVVSSSRGRKRETGGNSSMRLTLAYLIALGIGLHNLGEGLAIGAAYNAGELALGASLVVGFALHNTTEGLAIIAPMVGDSFSRKKLLTHLALMGALAGVPTIAGAWIGGFAQSALWGVIFMAVGAGAIWQVVVALTQQVSRRSAEPGEIFNWNNLFGLMAGFGIMFGTGLLV
jgi:zinc transporter ZupT